MKHPMIDCKCKIFSLEMINKERIFSYEEARAVHDNDQYELESERFQQQQLPNWDDDDDLIIYEHTYA